MTQMSRHLRGECASLHSAAQLKIVNLITKNTRYDRGTECNEVPLDRILVQLFSLRRKKDEWTAYRDSRTLMQYYPSTETRLTSEIETGSGEPRPYGRPDSLIKRLFIKVSEKKP